MGRFVLGQAGDPHGIARYHGTLAGCAPERRFPKLADHEPASRRASIMYAWIGGGVKNPIRGAALVAASLLLPDAKPAFLPPRRFERTPSVAFLSALIALAPSVARFVPSPR
jgi:hypothetical protein